jgi:alkylation response protein AidB-like acyl-CoA dehydrogenase
MFCHTPPDAQTDAIRRSVREFATREIAPVAAALDEGETFSVELTRAMGALGLLGCNAPGKYGSASLTQTEYVCAVEELARVDASQAATVAAHTSLGVWPVVTFGTESQKNRFLPPLCSGEGLWGFGLTEPDAGSDAQATRTTAVFDPSRRSWTINGRKQWVTNGSTPITHGLTVQAVTGTDDRGRRELSCFLVPADAAGLTRTPIKRKLMWRASDTAEVVLDNVEVGEDLMLGNRGEGFRIMMSTLDGGRLSIAAMGLGLARGVLELATSYAKTRRTFGKAIIEHQAIAFMLAEMATRIEASDALLYRACALYDAEQDFRTFAAMAKLNCSQTAEFCARNGQQVFGGNGLMKDFPVERHYRDAALLRIGEGTDEILKLVIARTLARD